MRAVQSVNPQSVYQCALTMEKKNKSEYEIEMFYGFWKYAGVFASFILGIVLFWWGANILLNDFYYIRMRLGLISYLTLAPLFFGGALSWMGFSEFLSMIRNNKK